MRKIYFFCALLITLSTGLIAQNTAGKVSGVVLDNSNKPLSQISVSILKTGDSSLVKVAITNKEGKYEFENIDQGNYSCD